MTARPEGRDTPAARAPRAGVRDRLGPWIWIVAAALALGTALSFAGRLAWFLELGAHFRVQFLIGSVLVLALFAACRRPRGAALALALSGVNAASVVPLYLGPERLDARKQASAPLRLLIANVHTHNREPGRVVELIRTERPDLILLLETDRAWLSVLEVLAGDYPHRIAEPRSDNFGLAVYSRRPFAHAELPSYGPAEVPSAWVQVEHDGAPVNLLLTHTMPPVGRANAALRDAQTRAVADAAQRHGARTVLAGDFNMSPWSPVFADLLARSGLHDSARGFGVQPTWPARLPAPFRIPIDHCLHTADLVVTDRRTGPDIGSDHLPLLVALR